MAPECGICQERISEIGELDVCAHVYCFACIHRWAKTAANTCPVCRKPFKLICRKRLAPEGGHEAAEAGGAKRLKGQVLQRIAIEDKQQAEDDEDDEQEEEEEGDEQGIDSELDGDSSDWETFPKDDEEDAGACRETGGGVSLPRHVGIEPGRATRQTTRKQRWMYTRFVKNYRHRQEEGEVNGEGLAGQGPERQVQRQAQQQRSHRMASASAQQEQQRARQRQAAAAAVRPGGTASLSRSAGAGASRGGGSGAAAQRAAQHGAAAAGAGPTASMALPVGVGGQLTGRQGRGGGGGGAGRAATSQSAQLAVGRPHGSAQPLLQPPASARPQDPALLRESGAAQPPASATPRAALPREAAPQLGTAQQLQRNSRQLHPCPGLAPTRSAASTRQPVQTLALEPFSLSTAGIKLQPQPPAARLDSAQAKQGGCTAAAQVPSNTGGTGRPSDSQRLSHGSSSGTGNGSGTGTKANISGGSRPLELLSWVTESTFENHAPAQGTGLSSQDPEPRSQYPGPGSQRPRQGSQRSAVPWVTRGPGFGGSQAVPVHGTCQAAGLGGGDVGRGSQRPCSPGAAPGSSDGAKQGSPAASKRPAALQPHRSSTLLQLLGLQQ